MRGFYRFWYLPSIVTLLNLFFPPWPWSTSRSNVSNVNISEMVRACAKMWYGFLMLYLPSNGVVAKVLLRGLNLFFNNWICQLLLYRKRWELVRNCVIQLLKIWIFDIEWRRYESSTCRTLHIFSRSNNSNANITKTARVSSKMRHMTNFSAENE